MFYGRAKCKRLNFDYTFFLNCGSDIILRKIKYFTYNFDDDDTCMFSCITKIYDGRL